MPEVVRLVLLLLLKAPNLGQAEKLAWEYTFCFEDRPCSLAYEKYGLRLYLAKEGANGLGAKQHDDHSIAQLIIGKLIAASRCLENRLLSPMAKHEASMGNLVILNQLGDLREMYFYFRERAQDAWSGGGILARRHDERAADCPLLEPLRSIAERQEGFYCTIAMITAYFSALEHLLVFCLPATTFDPSTESITQFIGSRLFAKFDRIFGRAQDREAQAFRARLHSAAERFRNPYAHGGFDKSHGTMYFNFPGIGALPILLSDIRDHPRFQVVPARETTFDEVCALFDELDSWMRDGKVAYAVRWAERGLDMSFDSQHLARFREAAQAGPEAFENFIDYIEGWLDARQNMDW